MKELKEKCQALLESKDEELKDVKIRYLRSDIKSPLPFTVAFLFAMGTKRYKSCFSDFLKSYKSVHLLSENTSSY